ncbi:hypothetical protein ACFQMH_22030 [Streptomyces viridiviolaceus]|uniref:Uncharacterized protein n=1 Tax=Streptomyces viridiviolaceus TaxID=68282 RepID=A0ABW2E7G5_9ACTN|nr:hypothetical protein [Streptomyces viridiviolaceus]
MADGIPLPYDEDESAWAADDEYTEEDFATLAAFLFARIDPLILAGQLSGEIDPTIQALNDVVRTLLGQARAFRQWDNEPALASTWDALTTIAQPWRHHPDFRPGWERE